MATLLSACLLSSACAADPRTVPSEDTATQANSPGTAFARAQGTRTNTDAEPTVLHARNALFRFDRGIGFKIEQLVATARPLAPHPLITLDDPTSFRIKTQKGRVRVRAREVTRLFNEYTFAFDGAPLRNLQVTTHDGSVTLAGQYRRRGWVNFEVSGGLRVKNSTTIVLTAQQIQVEGRSAEGLLEKANVRLDAILDVNARGLLLSGNEIELDAEQLFPPPALDIAIVGVTVEPNGIVLELDSGESGIPSLETPDTDDDSYILLKGGDVRIMRTVVPDANVALLSAMDDRLVGLWLYDYREQIVDGYFNYRDTEGAAFIVRLPPLDEAT